jgi:AraC-like DNA-binding protein
VTVSAQTDTDLTFPATSSGVDLRADDRITAGTFCYEGADIVTGWHHHGLHQLEYALAGVAEVETAGKRYLLPPNQAVWIPAGLAHQTTLRRVRSISVFFAPEIFESPTDEARILAAAPVIREMIAYATRWPITRQTTDDKIDAFFCVLADVVAEWLGHEVPLCLPISSDPVVSSAMAFTDANLKSVDERSVCSAIGVSPRTLRRRFAESVDMSWSQYLIGSRVLRAMAQLVESNDSITGISVGVGFESVSAFTRAFKRYSNETPSAYRGRAGTGPDH